MKKKIKRLEYPTDLPYWKGLYFVQDNKGVQKIGSWFDESRVTNIVTFLDYLKNNPHPNVVNILHYQSSSPNTYSYEMPLMAKLSDSESRLINLILESEDYSYLKEEYRHKIYRLKKKHPKLSQVIKKIMAWGVYLDFHSENLMRDQYGNYKLIDIEGFGFRDYSVNQIIKGITARQ